jgi:hypothetical protein
MTTVEDGNEQGEQVAAQTRLDAEQLAGLKAYLEYHIAQGNMDRSAVTGARRDELPPGYTFTGTSDYRSQDATKVLGVGVLGVGLHAERLEGTIHSTNGDSHPYNRFAIRDNVARGVDITVIDLETGEVWHWQKSRSHAQAEPIDQADALERVILAFPMGDRTEWKRTIPAPLIRALLVMHDRQNGSK